MPITQWRPTWKPGEVSDMTALAFRKVFDFLYAQSSQQGPLAADGSAATNAALVTVPTTTVMPYGSGSGLLVTLARAGTWVINSNVAINVIGDANQQFNTLLLTNGVPLAKRGIGALSANGSLMISQSWTVTVSAGAQYVLQVNKAGGAGTSNADPTHSSLTAVWSGS